MLALLGYLIRLLLLLPLLLGGALVALLIVSLEAQPLVGSRPPLSPLDVARVEQILKRNDLRPQAQGTEATLELTTADLNQVADYVIHRILDANTRLVLAPQTLSGELTWKAPDNPINPYLNLIWQVREQNGELRLVRLRLGSLELSLDRDAAWPTDLLVQLLKRELPPLIFSELQRVALQADRLILVYRWDPQLIDHARGLAVMPAQRAAVEIYYRELEWVLAHRPQTLAELLPPLFRLAAERSVGTDPRAENRAALEALGLYGLGRGTEVLGGTSDSNLPSAAWVTLQGRQDLTRHYLVSAAVSANGDGRFTNPTGLFKEWQDSQKESGFSFVDLATDRAGSRLGKYAVTSPEQARLVQRRLVKTLRDEDLLPSARDLSAGLSERQLADRFGEIDGIEYQQLLTTIEQRLDVLPLYHLP